MFKKISGLGLCLLLASSMVYADTPFGNQKVDLDNNSSTSDEIDETTAKVEAFLKGDEEEIKDDDKKEDEKIEEDKDKKEEEEEAEDKDEKEEEKADSKKEEKKTSQYTVVAGDCLSAIARDLLGDASRWPELVELNKDKYPSLVSNPNLIYVGWVLTIPGGSSSSSSSSSSSTSADSGSSSSNTDNPTANPSSDDKTTVLAGKAPKRAVDNPTGAPSLRTQASPSGSGINGKSPQFKEWLDSALDTYGDWNMPAVKNKYGQTISVEMYMKGIMFIESNCTQRKSDGSLVTSYCGAMGFMQLMPATASELGVDATDPKQNIAGGCKLFQKIFSGNYGSAGKATGVDKLMLVACSYNAGPWSSLVKGTWQDLKNTGSSVQGYGIKLKMCLGLELTEDEKTYARNNMTGGQDLETYCNTCYSTAQGYGL